MWWLEGQIFSSQPGRAGEEEGGRSPIVGHDVLPCTTLYIHCTLLYTSLYMMY